MLCCAGEFFAETGEITLPGVRLARLTVTEPLRLLNLRGTAANGAGTIPAIGAVTQRATTQAWARWWYEHPQLADIDGLIYPASGSGDDAVALWERARGKMTCRRNHHWPLDDPNLDDGSRSSHTACGCRSPAECQADAPYSGCSTTCNSTS